MTPRNGPPAGPRAAKARRHIRYGVAAGLAVAATVAGPPAWADLLVLESSIGSIAAGSILPDNATYDVPSGGRLTVMLPNGRSETIDGPRRGLVKELSKEAPVDRSLWDAMAKMISGQAGSDRNVGATRSAIATSAARPTGFSWTNVPITAEGSWCVEKGARLQLERTGVDKELRVTLAEAGGSARAEVLFAVGQATAAWPGTVPLKAGNYLIVAPDRPMRQVTLQPVAPLPSREDTLSGLHGQRCTRQMELWLRSLGKS